MESVDETHQEPEVVDEEGPPPCTECGKGVTWDDVLCPTCGSGLVAQRRPPRPPSRAAGVLYKLVLGFGLIFILAVLGRWALQVAEIFE